jgi:hypothetical protein
MTTAFRRRADYIATIIRRAVVDIDIGNDNARASEKARGERERGGLRAAAEIGGRMGGVAAQGHQNEEAAN